MHWAAQSSNLVSASQDGKLLVKKENKNKIKKKSENVSNFLFLLFSFLRKRFRN
jgi:hypothetical protein